MNSFLIDQDVDTDMIKELSRKLRRELLISLLVDVGTSAIGNLFGEIDTSKIKSIDDLVKDNRYPFPMYHLELNGQDVYVCGVLHSWIHSHIGRYRYFINELKKTIKSDDRITHVVLEGPDFIYSQQGRLDNLLRYVTIFIGGVFYPLNAMGFFWDIEKVARKNNKKLVVIDPITLRGALLYSVPAVVAAKYIKDKNK